MASEVVLVCRPCNRDTLESTSASHSPSPSVSGLCSTADWSARRDGYTKVPIQESVQDSQLSRTSLSPTPLSPSFPICVIQSIVCYTSISIAIVYFNWWLFTKTFQYPVFVSWTQQVLGLTSFSALSYFSATIPVLHWFHVCRKPQWKFAKRVFPLSLSFIALVALSNLCLKFVQISTYQVARSLTLLFTLILSVVLLGDRHQLATVLSCGMMVLGFIVGALDSTTLSFYGGLAGALSSVFQAFYNVTVKKVLCHTDDNPHMLLYYNLWWSSFLFAPVVLLCGESEVFKTLIWRPWVEGFFFQWGSLFFSGILATLMNLTSYWCIQVTSPVTFNVVSFTKAVVQSLGGIVFLGDVITVNSSLGIVLSLGGSCWYSFSKLYQPKYEVVATAKDESGLVEMESCEQLELGQSGQSPVPAAAATRTVDARHVLEALVKEQRLASAADFLPGYRTIISLPQYNNNDNQKCGAKSAV